MCLQVFSILLVIKKVNSIISVNVQRALSYFNNALTARVQSTKEGNIFSLFAHLRGEGGPGSFWGEGAMYPSLWS